MSIGGSYAKVHSFTPTNSSSLVAVKIGEQKENYHTEILAKTNLPGKNSKHFEIIFQDEDSFCVQACWEPIDIMHDFFSIFLINFFK